MNELPPVESLSPSEAKELIGRIRGQLRPRQLEALKALYGAGGGAGDADIMAEELRLQKLDSYTVGLLPRLGKPPGSLGWEREAPPAEVLENGAPHRLVVKVDMAYSPENHECVHGPSTAVPAVGLAGEMLASGERVSGIERITWALPLRHSADLHFWDVAAEGDGPGTSGATFHGELSTSASRRIAFAGFARDDEPLVEQLDYNRLTLDLVKGQGMAPAEEPDSVRMGLSSEGLAACRERLANFPGMRAAVQLDLVPVAILNWQKKPMVACGYRDVPLPAGDGAFGEGVRLELRFRKELSHHSKRSGLWIGYYDFRYAPWQEDWSTMVMAEAESPQALLEKLHS
ncbi:MAG: hypothetical protein AAGF23_02005 [Acidobacteriota bacterium]